MTLLKMSFYGAVIIFAVLIIRAITLHKLPKKTFLILWAVALVRLLIPFDISSDYSLYSLLPEEMILTGKQETNLPDAQTPYEPFENYADSLKQPDTPAVTDHNSSGTIYLPKNEFTTEAISLPDVETAAAYAKGTLPAEKEPLVSGFANTDIHNTGRLQTLLQNIFPYLLVIWAAGAFLCGTFFFLSYVRCRREFCTSLPVTEDYATEWLAQHPSKRTITIRQSDKISAPLTYGIFHPVILLPKKTDWTNLSQLDYVLYHEFTHIRRFDLAAKLVMIAALCIHWFNPLVWAMYVFFNRDLELSCDDCVVRHFGETKSAYANTLIGMEERRNYGTPLCNHFSKNAIEERITAIMKSKKTTIGMVIAAMVIIAIVVITLTTGRKEKEVATDITPAPTESVTPSVTPVPTKTVSVEPTHAPGAIIYSPEQNYIYNETGSAEFNYNKTGVSPEGGYDFVISSLISEKGEPVLSDVTVHLEAYAGNTAWDCMAAFYEEETGNVYLEFVPAAGVEEAPSGILHVTIPAENPTEYTVHPAGDFHAQKASSFWFGDVCKIKNKIYFNNGSCNGSLWVYDISTGEMSDLTYVNEKMQELANELCTDFGWENEPAIWFNVGWYSDNGITTYEAGVCKEMDTETFFIMRVYYQDDLYLDYSYSYKGSQEEPYTQEELTSRIKELFFRYLDMQDEFFTTNLKVASSLATEDMITINGTGGYTKVLDERFPNMKSVIDYMETICTPQLALNLRSKNWRVTTSEPVVTEWNGVLYTQCYDGVKFGEDYRFFPVSIDGPDICSLSYEAYIDIPSNKTESGTMYFRYMDGNWYVWHHEYVNHHNFVDSLDIKIMADLFSKYRTMWTGLFNSNLECGYYSNPPVREVTISGISGYYKVLDERFPTMQSLIDYMETIYTPDFAAELRQKYYLNADSDYPLLTEMDGMLYTQAYHSSTNGFSEEFQFTDLQCNESGTVIVSYQSSSNPFIYSNMVEAGTITFRVMERGGWRIASLDCGYKNLAPVFPQLPATDVIVTGKNWCLTYIDEITFPRYQELANDGAKAASEESTYINVGRWYTLSLDGISYFFYQANAPSDNEEAFAIAITSPEYPLSGGAKVGMTVEALLSLYPTLAKTNLVYEDPAFETQYGPTMYSFRPDQFPPAFLNEYEYAYIALTEKEYPGLPICIVFLIKDGVVSAITEYMPTAN